jgi:flavodoxin
MHSTDATERDPEVTNVPGFGALAPLLDGDVPAQHGTVRAMSSKESTMKSLIVCTSKSHGNTRRVADRMAEVLDAETVTPESVDPETLCEYDLVGFGSGIYYMTVDARLRNLIRHLPTVDHIRAFTFYTSGARSVPLLDYNKPVRKRLEEKGFEVIGSFSCRGFDTVGPFRFIGGINRGRPNDYDLDRAAAFAARLGKHVRGSQAAP